MAEKIEGPVGESANQLSNFSRRQPITSRFACGRSGFAVQGQLNEAEVRPILRHESVRPDLASHVKVSVAFEACKLRIRKDEILQVLHPA